MNFTNYDILLIPFPTVAKHKLLKVIAYKEASDPRIPLGLVEVITSKVLPLIVPLVVSTSRSFTFCIFKLFLFTGK